MAGFQSFLIVHRKAQLLEDVADPGLLEFFLGQEEARSHHSGGILALFGPNNFGGDRGHGVGGHAFQIENLARSESQMTMETQPFTTQIKHIGVVGLFRIFAGVQFEEATQPGEFAALLVVKHHLIRRLSPTCQPFKEFHDLTPGVERNQFKSSRMRSASLGPGPMSSQSLKKVMVSRRNSSSMSSFRTSANRMRLAS